MRGVCGVCVCLQIIFAQVGFILAVATYLVAQGGLGDRMYDGVEYFSGVATWTASLRKNGFRCATFEILDDSVHGDLLSPEGMINAMKLVFEVFQLNQLTSKLHFPIGVRNTIAGVPDEPRFGSIDFHKHRFRSNVMLSVLASRRLFVFFGLVGCG